MMNNLSHTPEDKLLVMAENVVICRDEYKSARISGDTQQEVQQFGRLNKSVSALAKAARQVRAAEGER